MSVYQEAGAAPKAPQNPGVAPVGAVLPGKAGAKTPGASPKPASAKGKLGDHKDPKKMGIYLVGWTQSQVDLFLKGLGGMAGITASWDPTSYLLSYTGDDTARMAARKTEGRWSQEMHTAWKNALVAAPRHSVVIGAQDGDTDSVQGGYAGAHRMVLDMMDIGAFAADTTRVERSFDIYWVMTHELLGHFYLGLGHGAKKGYKSGDIKTYNYKDDDTLQVMNEWRTQMGLPVRLQHPPRVEGQKRSYIFVDAFPGQPTIDLDAKKADPTVKLPPLKDRKAKFDALRAKVQGKLSVPGGLDLKYFPEARYTDDDTDAKGQDLPGRGHVLPTLRWGRRGDEVKLAQRKLNEHGATLDEDGVFKKLSKKATVEFQKNHKPLDVDGVVGTNTWSMLLGYQVMTKADEKARLKGHRLGGGGGHDHS